MRKNFVEELKWRGMLAQIMPGTEELLQREMVTAYLGTDPTADSLHIGHLCGIMMLRHLQRCGHKPIILVGGATGMIGDPSGKSQERNLLNDETLRHNQECIKKQVARFLDFESTEPNAAEMVNNYDWMKDFTFLDFAREVGKHITVNYMMAKDSVQQRLNGTARDGLSFTEFTYQLLQGYDFLYLYQHKGVKLQLGGNDQWGNMTTGTELIRRTLGNDVETFALTCPLITKSDGKKFGKTESGNVWLDAKRTSPYRFYQFWLNVSDEEAEKYIKIFTSLDKATRKQRSTSRFLLLWTRRLSMRSLRSTVRILVVAACSAASVRKSPSWCMVVKPSTWLSKPRTSSSVRPRRKPSSVSTSRRSSMSSTVCLTSRLLPTSWVSLPSNCSPPLLPSSLRRVRCAKWCRVAVSA